jgi:hypothetical protein
MRARSLLFPLAAFGLLAACDGSPTAAGDPLDEGSFVATVTGSVSASFNAAGRFHLFDPPPVQGFARPGHFRLHAADLDAQNQRGQMFEMQRLGGSVPPVGRYTLVPDPLRAADSTAFSAQYSFIQGQTHLRYIARAGEVEITRSTPQRVEGRFRFTGAQVCAITPDRPACLWPLLPWQELPDLDALPAVEVSGTFVATWAPSAPGFGG